MPPDVAQAHLPRDLARGEEVGAEHRIFQPRFAREFARVHVDRGKRFGLVDDQIRAALQLDAVIGQRTELLFQPEKLKHLAFAGIADQLVFQPALCGGKQLFGARIRLCVAYIHLVHARQVEIAQQPRVQIPFAEHAVANGSGFIRFARVFVHAAQRAKFLFKQRKARPLRLCAQDDAALGRKFFCPVQHPFARLLVRDLARYGAERRRREIDQIFADKRHVHREARALRADGRFGDLHHHGIADLYVEFGGHVALRLRGHVSRGEVAVPVRPVRDKRRLHACQHIDDAPFINIPGCIAIRLPVRVKFDKFARFDDRCDIRRAEAVEKSWSFA